MNMPHTICYMCFNIYLYEFLILQIYTQVRITIGWENGKQNTEPTPLGCKNIEPNGTAALTEND